MKWAVWMIALPLFYVLSIGPVAYFKTRSSLGPGYVHGTYAVTKCTSYVFFRGTAVAGEFSTLPRWVRTFYAPLHSLAESDQVPGRWVNDYTTWWVALAY